MHYIMTYKLLNTRKFDEFVKSRNTNDIIQLLYLTPEINNNVKYLYKTIIPSSIIDYISLFLYEHLDVICSLNPNYIDINGKYQIAKPPNIHYILEFTYNVTTCARLCVLNHTIYNFQCIYCSIMGSLYKLIINHINNILKN